MRILVTADLHYDIGRSRQGAADLAARACLAGGDALVLVGDTAGAELEPWRQCLNLFGAFSGLKFLVPGNHCLWCRSGENSIERYDVVLPGLAAEAGFRVLDHQPAVLGSLGLAGSVGWYDYSFADPSLDMPEDFYLAKISPGAAAYVGGHEQLLLRHQGRLHERHLSMGVRWMDGVHVRLGISDDEFVLLLAAKLRGQLEDLSASARVGRIAAFIHHLPFADLVPRGRPPRVAFAAAFMGAGRLGEVLRDFPKVKYVYCGHSHWPMRRKVGHMTVVNVGSTYVDKRLEILEVPESDP